MSDTGQEKTQKPTEKQRQNFREKGDVPKSREIGATIGLAVASLMLLTNAENIALVITDTFVTSFRSAANPVLDEAALHHLKEELTRSIMNALFVPLLVLMVSATIIETIQTRFIIPKEPLKLRWEKLNVFKGMKQKFFSSQPVMELAKGLVKLICLGGLVGSALVSSIGMFPAMGNASALELAQGMEDVVIMVLKR
ncbi:MAG: EscU/YscU/HrcU family type III secretion system export apparatus switch protein, partial [Myxococcota bacterium]|nr:EscU/YscU/HrcU family type III secretion system export apparatus switch protein [Myxococcota bacterium]